MNQGRILPHRASNRWSGDPASINKQMTGVLTDAARWIYVRVA